MPEIKKSTIIVLTIGILLVSMVLGVEGVFSSSDLDFICDTDNSILYRTAGQWICSSLPAGSAEATTTTLGTVKVINCTGTDKLSGYTGTNIPVCTADIGSGTVTSISQATGITINPNPLVSTGTIMLSNATTSAIGGVRVANCSAGSYVYGWDVTNSPLCTTAVYALSGASGLSVSGGGTIIGAGTLTLDEAITAKKGGVKVINCSAGSFISGYDATVIPTCTAGASGTVTSISQGTGTLFSVNPITTTGTINIAEATTTTIGGVKVANCTAGVVVTGWKSGGTPQCNAMPYATTSISGSIILANCTDGNFFNGFNSIAGVPSPKCQAINNASWAFSQITLFEGLSSNESPMIHNATLMLNNASELLIGGTHVYNCSGNGHVSGWFGNMTPFCSDNGNSSGTVTSISVDSTITANPSPITTTGTLMATNATITQLGVTKLTNCSTGFYLNGWNATNIPNCVGELNNGSVTSITAGTGLSGGVITGIGTIDLNEALVATIGGVKIINCSANNFIQSYAVGVVPTCATFTETGTVSSLTSGEGIVFNPAGTITSSGVIMGANATTAVRGIVMVANCTSTDKVSGWSAGNIPVCTADSVNSVVPTNSFRLSDRVLFIRTITNVGTTFVDIYLTAFDPEDSLINTTNMTGFRIMITMDYVSGAGATESVSFNQTSTNANKLWVFNTTADCDPCDSGWQTIPSWASSIETSVEPQWKSTTAADDPSFKGYQIWLR